MHSLHVCVSRWNVWAHPGVICGPVLESSRVSSAAEWPTHLQTTSSTCASVLYFYTGACWVTAWILTLKWSLAKLWLSDKRMALIHTFHVFILEGLALISSKLNYIEKEIHSLRCLFLSQKFQFSLNRANFSLNKTLTCFSLIEGILLYKEGQHL